MDKLNIPDNYTFGVEIEYVGVDYNIMEDYFSNLKNTNKINSNWNLDTDMTVLYKGDIYKAGEIKSYIMHNTKEDLIELKNMCNVVIEMNGFTDELCAGHIHIGNNAYNNNPKNVKNLILLWLKYEEIIFRYASGKDKNLRPYVWNRSKPLFSDCYDKKIKEIFNDDVKYDELVKRIVRGIDRNYSINFLNLTRMRMDTTEFRIPNGTLDYNIWFNNITFFSNLIEYAKKMNYEESEYTFEEIKNGNKIEKYLTINEKKALELVNKIYNSNNDKENFMKQYIK